VAVHPSADLHPQHGESSSSNWRRRLPVLRNRNVTLRELRSSDATSLLEHLCTERVLQHIAEPPRSIDRFRRFIRWTHAQRRKGTHMCFGLVPPGESGAVGIVQLWPIEPDFSTSEWGFVVGDAYWGTGLFVSGARLLIDFVFGQIGVNRLEARAVAANDRGNGVLRKLGAKPEGVLRQAFRRGDSFHDHVMWSILAADWAEIRRQDRRTS
jgi:ribosomal-protein-alanine N-acetyltransferase